MAKEKITLDYSFGASEQDPGTVVFSIKGTGIDANNPQHRKFMEVLLNVVGTQMYAHAHNVDHKHIVTTSKLPPSNGN